MSGSAATVVVLVVEDEPLVRMHAVDLLEDEGFTVIEAGTGDEGLAFLHARPDIDVLFTDVEMPGSLDGLALARQTVLHFPGVCVLIVSGRALPTKEQLASGACFFSKPYRGQAIVDHIRTVSADRPSTGCTSPAA